MLVLSRKPGERIDKQRPICTVRARARTRADAKRLVRARAASLLAKIENFLQNPQILFRAAEASRSCGKPDSARRLGNLVTAIAAGWDKEALMPFDLTQGHEG